MSEEVGSPIDEAVKLLGAAQEWLRTRFDSEHFATGAAECQVCPVCQVVAAVRGVRPETVEHLLDATASFVAAVKTTVHAHDHTPGPPSGGSGKVQKIDIREG